MDIMLTYRKSLRPMLPSFRINSVRQLSGPASKVTGMSSSRGSVTTPGGFDSH